MLKKFKERLQRRIERNAIKVPNAQWTDSNGIVHIEDIILKRSRIPLVGDWGRIYPPLNEDGKINWINTIFGGKKNFTKLIIMLLFVAFVLYAFYAVFSSYALFREQPCIKSCIELAKATYTNPLGNIPLPK